MAETEVKKGLEGVVVAETALSNVQGDIGKLTYAGYNIHELAERVSFEEVVFLLWNLRLPNRAELTQLQQTLSAESPVPDTLLGMMTNFPKSAHPMGVLRTGVSVLGVFDAESEDASPEANRRKALRLTAKMPTIVAAWQHIRQGKEPVAPRKDLSLAANFMYMFKGTEPDPVDVAALDLYLVLLADHGMNASTFTSRAVTSTDSDIYSAITAAIGSLKGFKHGGANEAAMRMFEEISHSPSVMAWFNEEIKGKGRRVMGMGHRIYKTLDPRAVVLRRHAEAVCAQRGCPYLQLAIDLEELARTDAYFIERNLYPNVDYYSAILLDAIGIPTDMMTPLFAMSRIAGWSAHVIEQWTDNRLMRPRSNYIGPSDLSWVPVDER